jgi:hypothetical protein
MGKCSRPPTRNEIEVRDLARPLLFSPLRIRWQPVRFLHRLRRVPAGQSMAPVVSKIEINRYSPGGCADCHSASLHSCTQLRDAHRAGSADLCSRPHSRDALHEPRVLLAVRRRSLHGRSGAGAPCALSSQSHHTLQLVSEGGKFFACHHDRTPCVSGLRDQHDRVSTGWQLRSRHLSWGTTPAGLTGARPRP